MIAIIDNYDSFTYNLYQLIGEIDPDVAVFRNDALSVDELAGLRPSHIVLSPGPGYPRDAGICIDVVRQLAGLVPILGVCLGHQAICEAYGARIGPASRVMHGKSSLVSVVCEDPLLAGLPSQFAVGRYHSLSADPVSIPDELVVTAVTKDGEIQSVRHRDRPVFGVQYHPESVLTPLGRLILANFLTTSTQLIARRVD